MITYAMEYSIFKNRFEAHIGQPLYFVQWFFAQGRPKLVVYFSALFGVYCIYLLQRSFCISPLYCNFSCLSEAEILIVLAIGIRMLFIVGLYPMTSLRGMPQCSIFDYQQKCI